MGFKLIQVQEDEEFYELFQVYRAAFTNPGTKLWTLFTTEPISKIDSQKASHNATTGWAEYLIAAHRADPTSTWLKIIDESDGMVLGGGRWLIDKDSFDTNPGRSNAAWWPAGTPRNIASECLTQFRGTRTEHMQRPHAFLNILFTHPDHRGKGIASLVMRWGLERADSFGIDAYIEATMEGLSLYEKFGFNVIDTREFHLDTASTEEEKEMESLLLPFQWWSMLRPAST